jgi:NADPH:quinone reductase-like Zn-dependent oxidoreductase
MRAAAVVRFGGPEVLKIQELPVPVPDANEVLIKLDTSGVGPWDADIRGGWYPAGEPHFPLIPGTDGAGYVAEVGPRISRFKTGDTVYSYSWDNQFGKGGFYAEYVAVPADKAAHVPEPLDLLHAGACATTGLTALQGVDDALHLKKGETIIIHGASGGVGTLAVQFAHLRGARIFATASGEDGAALVRRLGAETAIDGHSDAVAEAARAFAPKGFDALLALSGDVELEHCLKALRRGGRCAHPNGVELEREKRDRIKIIAYDAVAGVAEFERLNRAIEEAQLEVPIAASYPLADAAKAHERLAAGHVLGKIVLRIQ